MPYRFVDALVGGGVGLAVLIAVPRNPVTALSQAVDPPLAELAAVLGEVAAALESRDATPPARPSSTRARRPSSPTLPPRARGRARDRAPRADAVEQPGATSSATPGRRCTSTTRSATRASGAGGAHGARGAATRSRRASSRPCGCSPSGVAGLPAELSRDDRGVSGIEATLTPPAGRPRCSRSARASRST